MRLDSVSPALLVQLFFLSPGRTAVVGYPVFRTRAFSSAKPARPYIERLINFSRLIRPSTGPLLHTWFSPARTADSSRANRAGQPLELSQSAHFGTLQPHVQLRRQPTTHQLSESFRQLDRRLHSAACNPKTSHPTCGLFLPLVGATHDLKRQSACRREFGTHPDGAAGTRTAVAIRPPPGRATDLVVAARVPQLAQFAVEDTGVAAAFTHTTVDVLTVLVKPAGSGPPRLPVGYMPGPQVVAECARTHP